MTDERSESAGPAAGDDSGAQRHSNHPFAVMVPIGAWAGSLVCDVLSHYGVPDNRFARLSRDAMAAGVLGASVAGAIGLRDLVRFSPARRPGALGYFHAGLNMAAVAYYGAASLRRNAIVDEVNIDGYDGTDVRPDGRVSLVDVLQNAGVLAVLGLSGALGGMLAQRFDVKPG